MAFIDLYNTLSEEQKDRLRKCRSISQVTDFFKTEGIELTEDHLEALYARLDRYAFIESVPVDSGSDQSKQVPLTRKKEDEQVIQTGLFGRYFEPSAEWLELLDTARENERTIRCLYPSAEEQESAACRLISGESRIFQAALCVLKDVRNFCEFCLELRGPFKGAKQRKLVREQTRLLGYLAEGAPIPDSPEAVLALWETANRLEPRWADDLPAHFRTISEDVPFSHAFFPPDPKPVPDGCFSSHPEEIRADMLRLLDRIHGNDLPHEMSAFISFYQFLRIHPFPDGNGHTARMLCCGLLSRDYSAVTLTAFLRQMLDNHYPVWKSVNEANLRNGDICGRCCQLMRLLIRGQEQVRENS